MRENVIFMFVIGMILCFLAFSFYAINHEASVRGEYQTNVCKRRMEDRNADVHNVSYIREQGFTDRGMVITCVSTINHPDSSFITKEYRTFEVNF